MKSLSIVFAAVIAIAIPTVADAQYYDGFDAYTAGSSIVGQGGWEAWAGDPTVDATVSNAFANTAPNSLNISPLGDVTQTLSGITTGIWYAKAQVYIPAQHSGDAFFILLNTYDGGACAPGGCNWSAQIRMSGTDMLVESMGGTDNPSAGATLPLIVDQWVEIIIEIDLDTNYYNAYYDGTLLDSLPWTVSGLNEIKTFDLYCDGCSDSYFDDIYLGDTVPVSLQKLSVE